MFYNDLIHRSVVSILIQNCGYDLEYRADRNAMLRELYEIPVAEVISIEWMEEWKRWANIDGDKEMARVIDFLLEKWKIETENE